MSTPHTPLEHLRTGQYRCERDLRTEAVRDATTVNGIDYLEVLPGQTRLEVHFLHPLPGEAGEVPVGGKKLNKTHVIVEGGDRVRGVRALSTSTSGEVLTVTVSGPGDFSTYRFRLVDPETERTPTGFDPRLSSIEFSFKAGCPIRFDCAPRDVCPPPVPTSAVQDYLAKDYASFRRLMLDRLATTVPGWRERSPADQQVALVELLAFVADRLSYQQDAVATEAYLGTARRRVSVRRHARMLGYRMHEGCAARTFVQARVSGSSSIPITKGTRFLTGSEDAPGTLVFESLHDVTAHPDHNRLDLYTWTDEQCCLPKGATRATLIGGFSPALVEGQFLLFEEIAGSRTGRQADADRTHRHVVRLTEVITFVDPSTGEPIADPSAGGPLVDPLDGAPIVEVAWSTADALPFPFCVSASTTDGTTEQPTVCGVARGNVVLVEHGATVEKAVTLGKETDVAGRWLPSLPEGQPTCAVPYQDRLPADPAGAKRRTPASALLDLDPREALPRIQVRDQDGNDYDPVWDLMASSPEDAHFVVETEEDGRTTLRFGDGTYGRKPDPGRDHDATFRVGHGTVGNVGPEAIRRMSRSDADVTVHNPVPATGGADPEPTEKARLAAPHAFRVQERAVTEADYGTVLTERMADVQRAAGRMRWTGSWYTAFVTVDRVGGCAVDASYRQDVRRFLDRYRMAGVDVDVASPLPVPLEIELAVCARADRFNTDVERDVLDVLSSRVLPDGRRGFFHPDNFTFGTPVYLSRIYAAVLGIPGVETVRATRFQRYGRPPPDEPGEGVPQVVDRETDTAVLRVEGLEIAQLANDPDVPERGVLTVTVAGGR